MATFQKEIYDSLYGIAVYGTDLYGSLYEEIAIVLVFKDKFLKRIFGYGNIVVFDKPKIKQHFDYGSE
jgi:hypothetical protein